MKNDIARLISKSVAAIRTTTHIKMEAIIMLLSERSA